MILNYKKESFQKRLEFIYSTIYSQREITNINIEIQKLIKTHRKIYKNHEKNYKLSEKDVILITYGDQIIENGEAPLFTLKKFLDENIKNIINTIHILPFYPYSSDDGFSVVDYYKVSPLLGSWREIDDLNENYRLMFDAVVNHISRYSYWFQKFLENEEKYREYFLDIDPSTDLTEVVRPRTSPLLNEYRDINNELHYIWTTFSKDQIDLNYQSSQVLITILDVLLFYVQNGVKFIRLDAIAFLWKEIGTKSVHLPKTHEIIKLMREVIHEVAPEVIIITETNVPHDENISYFGDGESEAHMVYNFALPPLLAFSILKQDGTKLTNWAKSLTLPSKKVCFFNFNASHDGVGLRAVSDILTQTEIDFLVEKAQKHGGKISYRADKNGQKPYEMNCSYINLLSDENDSEDKFFVKRMILAQAITLVMPGIAGIYFQSLVGGTNFYNGVEHTGSNRTINREKYFLDNLNRDLKTENSIKNTVFHSMKKLLSIRVGEKAFYPFGKFEILDTEKINNSAIFGIIRYSEDQKESILALHNLSDKTVELNISDFAQKFTNGHNITENKICNDKLILQEYNLAWIKI
jgi:sucrose phosphorylase